MVCLYKLTVGGKESRTFGTTVKRRRVIPGQFFNLGNVCATCATSVCVRVCQRLGWNGVERTSPDVAAVDFIRERERGRGK